MPPPHPKYVKLDPVQGRVKEKNLLRYTRLKTKAKVGKAQLLLKVVIS